MLQIACQAKASGRAADTLDWVGRNPDIGMGSILERVERHTRLAGHNRVAMLLFGLGEARARCAINVYKVREVLRCPPIEPLPGQHEWVAGAVDYRGRTIPAIDLAQAFGLPALVHREQVHREQAHLVVAEFSRSIQAFVVGAVDRIVHIDVASIEPPRGGMVGARVSATTRVDGGLVMIADVEQILAETSGTPASLSNDLHGLGALDGGRSHKILIVDDSTVARRHVADLAEKLGLVHELAADGEQALALLREAVGRGLPAVVVSDIEMPRLDGYALTRAIREDARFAGVRVLLHSSLSGGFNGETVTKVGADRFVAKFHSDALARALLELLEAG